MKTNILNRRLQGVMKHFSFFIFLFSFALASCDRDDSHIVVQTNPDNPQGGAIVGFNTSGVTIKKFEDTHLYGFNAVGKMILHRYYPMQQELSNDLFHMDNGAYTFIAVLNVGESFTPQSCSEASLHNFTMNQFMSYLKRSESSYPDMLTGMLTRTITNNTVERIEIPLADNSDGITATITTFVATITLPNAEFTEYQQPRSRATAAYNLRGIVEFRQKKALISRTVSILTPTATAGQYTLTAEVFDGDYDVALWVDYTAIGSEADLWYKAQSLEAITLIHTDKSYSSGSDSREVFYYAGTFAATGGETPIEITLERPQAKYALITNDLARYRELMRANPDKYVSLNELSVEIVYESSLPYGFNVSKGKPNESENGFKSNGIPLPAVVATDTEVKIGSDYVFDDGTGSSVIVTVLVKDKRGKTVSRVQGVQVDYKRNMLTTITGDFLTAGVINPGINIDTDWDDIFEVEF